MKRIRLFLLLLCIPLWASAANSSYVRPTICPEPQSFEISDTVYHPLTRVSVRCADKTALEWAQTHLNAWYGELAPKVVWGGKESSDMGEGAYELSAGKKEVAIKASTLQGIRYALYSLRQITIAQRGTLSVEGWIIPECTIQDHPDMAFRGVHICWFHETEPWEVERLIRLAAYYKMNYAVIESWGTFRSEIAPWYGWEDGTMTKEEVARLKAIADDLGITLIPQINVFGHATMSRGGAGKHAVLEFHPEYQTLFEPCGGWNWCLSSPAVRKLLPELIEERMDAFGNPPYFHIGGDEAHQPSCPDCIRQDYAQLFIDHIRAMHDVIAARGAKTMMWHDMLIDRADPRWEGFTHNGNDLTAKAILDFPRDIVICDWYYGEAKEAYPVADYFKSLGFPVLACPWNKSYKGTIAMSQNAHKAGLDGILVTLWHHYYGGRLQDSYFFASNIAWNAEASLSARSVGKGYGVSFRPFFHTHLRQIGWDMHTTDPRHTGIYYDELPPEPALYTVG